MMTGYFVIALSYTILIAYLDEISFLQLIEGSLCSFLYKMNSGSTITILVSFIYVHYSSLQSVINKSDCIFELPSNIQCYKPLYDNESKVKFITVLLLVARYISLSASQPINMIKICLYDK